MNTYSGSVYRFGRPNQNVLSPDEYWGGGLFFCDGNGKPIFVYVGDQWRPLGGHDGFTEQGAAEKMLQEIVPENLSQKRCPDGTRNDVRRELMADIRSHLGKPYLSGYEYLFQSEVARDLHGK